VIMILTSLLFTTYLKCLIVRKKIFKTIKCKKKFLRRDFLVKKTLKWNKNFQKRLVKTDF